MSYNSIILAESSLVSYWKLNEPSGSSATDSKDSNSGTYNGPFLYNEPGNAILTPSAYFNGTSSYISVPSASNLNPINLSVEAWIQTHGSVPSQQQFVTKYNGSFIGYGLRINSHNLGFYAGNGVSWLESGVAVDDTNWHHVVGTITSGGAIAVYVDGVLANSGTYAQSLSSVTDLHIGSDPSGNQNFNGHIMGVAIYNTALSGARILVHYNAPSSHILNLGMTAGMQEQGSFNC